MTKILPVPWQKHLLCIAGQLFHIEMNMYSSVSITCTPKWIFVRKKVHNIHAPNRASLAKV